MMPFIFGCLHDNQRLVNIIQAILVRHIYFLSRLQHAINVGATCSLPPDPVVANYLLDAINH